MSIESWKEEFLPPFPPKDAPVRDHVMHSLIKWRGALPENLTKHDVRYVDWKIFNLSPISYEDQCSRVIFGDTTCSLCRLAKDVCIDCPITRVNGVSCIGIVLDYNIWKGPYREIYKLSKNDPSPMIELLESTLAGIDKLK